MRSVEEGKAMLVIGKVGRHPIQDHADALLVQSIDEKHEVLGRPVPAGRGEVSGGLVSPGTIEGMLRDRQEFHMGETHFLDIGGKLRSKFPVVQGASLLW